MSGQKIFVIISSIINIVLLGFALFILMNGTDIGLFLTLFPLAVGLITFFIVKKVKNFELMRALKYFNVAYFASFVLPVGIFVLYQIFFVPRVVAMYGVQMDPVMEQCYQKCSEIVNRTSEAFRNCIENCRK
jgi:hypothetical protein